MVEESGAADTVAGVGAVVVAIVGTVLEEVRQRRVKS